MEDQKKRATPSKLKFKIKRSINGGFEIDNSYFQEITEKKTMEFPLKLKNQVPSSSFSLLPQWCKKAKRGRKSSVSSSTTSFSSLSSIEKQEDEKEVAEALLMLASGFSLDLVENNHPKKDRIITEFPAMKKKRKVEDTNMVNYAEGRSKKERIEKETRDYRYGFMLDAVKRSILSSSSTKFTCDFCRKSFSCYQALGGHKSKCRINCSKGEVPQLALQCSMNMWVS